MLTNTLPGRIHDAAIIAMAIPNARFLLVKRSLDDVIWRIDFDQILVWEFRMPTISRPSVSI